jgi:peptide-methionine (R)-S-oxide reductase
MDKVQRTGAQWREGLTPEGYRLLRQAGTESAWTGEYTDSLAPAAAEASG